MTPYWHDEAVTLHAGDCLNVLPTLPDASVDAVCADPPYAIAFMGRRWDDLGSGEEYAAWVQQWAVECLRVLKPGGHLLAFGAPRTSHWLTCGIELAGFEIRDSITWIYASGFPKSLDVSKAIDRAAGAEREVVGAAVYGDGHVQRSAESIGYGGSDPARDVRSLTAPATDDAKRWTGWGTALKPAQEPIVVARKPLAGTVAANVVRYGTGALNIDGCRVAHASAADLAQSEGKNRHADHGNGARVNHVLGDMPGDRTNYDGAAGRWPTNLVFSHSPDCAEQCAPDCPVAELDRQSGMSVSPASRPRTPDGPAQATWSLGRAGGVQIGHGDTGGASRFFPVFRYEPKAPTRERPRTDGEGKPNRAAIGMRRCGRCGLQAVNVQPSSQCQCAEPDWQPAASSQAMSHPTVKPLDLMRWLVRLVVPPGGTCLDPFAGSGTTAEACVIEGFRCITVEQDPTYLPLIVARLSKPLQPVLAFTPDGDSNEGSGNG